MRYRTRSIALLVARFSGRFSAAGLLVLGSLGHPSAAPLFPNPAFSIDGLPTAVVTGDFDGDGLMDLAVSAHYGGGGVSILRARGDGTFELPVVLGAGADASSAAVADFNGDGRADLAIGWSGAGGYLSVELGRGDGTFEHRGVIGTGAVPMSIAAGDTDGDGRKDLVVALYDPGAIQVLIGHGDGTFATGARLAAGSHTVSVALADFNGDRRLDLAAANHDSPYISFRLGRGDGTFADDLRVAVGNSIQAVGAADFTGDGLADLAVAGIGTNLVGILAGRSDGTLGALVIFGAGDQPSCVAFADVNGDGLPDLVFGNARSGDVSVFLATGVSPTFFAHQIRSRAGEGTAAVAVGAFNHDGFPDIVVGNASSEAVAMLAGHGDGSFGGARSFPTGPYPQWVAVGRLDSDRHLDLAVAARNDGNISVLRGHGDGGFNAPMTVDVGGNPRSVSIADLNGDGRSDLVAPLTEIDRVAVLMGRSDGSFSTSRVLRAGSGPSAAVAADFDGDGRIDLAVSNLYSDDVSIFRGRGDASFDAAVNVVAGDGPWSILAADFDGDHVLDLAVGDNGPISPTSDTFGLGDIATLRGHRSSGFDAGVAWPAGFNPRVIAIADFNHDGHPDIAAAALYNYVAVLLNDGSGHFTYSRYTAGVRTESVATGDVDSDGVADLVVANSQSGDISVLLGRGDGTFQPELRFLAGLEPFSVAVADLNEDRRQDIVVVNSLSDDVWVLLNEGPFPDTDGDGVTDDLDPCTDSDRDGFGDLDIVYNTCPVDNCPVDPNPLQVDSDGDGRGDVCDACAHDPLDDAEHDGFCADLDTCPTIADPGQEDADGDRRGDLCDNCPGAVNPLQEDANDDGSGDACQPSLEILDVRGGAPDTLDLTVRLRDPQNDPLSGVITLSESIDHPDTLLDLGTSLDCRQGFFPRGIEGGGIGFANGSAGAPVLFDFALGVEQFGLPCAPAGGRYGIAEAPCGALGGIGFQEILGIGPMALPAPLCMAPLDAYGVPLIAEAIDLVLTGYDADSLDLSQVESRTSQAPFGGGLPRRIDLTALVTGAAHHLAVTVTDGNTLPVTAATAFTYAGQSTLLLHSADPPRAVIKALTQAIECDRQGGALVALDGTGSGEPGFSGGDFDYQWVLDPGRPTERPLGSGAILQALIPPGTHELGLIVADAEGQAGSARTPVTVTDTMGPVITASIKPAILWPPNHRMVDVTATVVATDRCAVPRTVLESITISDPGEGSDKTSGDIDGASFGEPDFQFRLRAERRGSADRVYSVTYRSDDGSGNATTITIPVVVSLPPNRQFGTRAFHPPYSPSQWRLTPPSTVSAPRPSP